MNKVKIISIIIHILSFLTIGILIGIIPFPELQKVYTHDQIDPWSTTLVRIVKIYNIIVEYKIRNNFLPKNEEETNRLLMSDRIFRQWIARDVTFKGPIREGLYCFDDWGHQLRYNYLKKNNKGEESFIIYSYGPNGIDENGQGDDVSIKYP